MLDIINNIINNMKILKFQIIGLDSNRNLVKAYKELLKNLLTIQIEATIDSMLEDTSLQTQNKGKPDRIKFEWGNKNKPYLDHVYSLFDKQVLAEPHEFMLMVIQLSLRDFKL